MSSPPWPFDSPNPTESGNIKNYTQDRSIEADLDDFWLDDFDLHANHGDTSSFIEDPTSFLTSGPILERDQNAAQVVEAGIDHNTTIHASTSHQREDTSSQHTNIHYGRLKGPETLGDGKGESDDGSNLSTKKQHHNAKERVRRMNLNASYLALGALLPPSCISKKRWTAPAIIDGALDYIPELKNEIEDLTLKKNQLLPSPSSSSLPDHSTKQFGIDPSAETGSSHHDPPQGRAVTVSVHEVARGEVVAQICMQKRDGDNDHVFSNLIRKVEEDQPGISILSASTLLVGDDRICCHLHINQMDESAHGTDEYTAVFKEKLISYLS